MSEIRVLAVSMLSLNLEGEDIFLPLSVSGSLRKPIDFGTDGSGALL